MSVNANLDKTDLNGKRIVLSGGSTGIGLATARKLAAAGARIVTFARHAEELQKAVEELSRHGEVHGIPADAASRDDLEAVFRHADEKLGGVDVLINNAAIGAGSVVDGSPEDWQYAVQTNVLGYIHATGMAIQRMKANGGGHIVCVGSMSADLREKEGDIYAATKAAVQAFCESLRKSVNPLGIRVSLVEPGAIDTPMQTKPQEKKDEMKQEASMLPPEDIADCVYYCLTQPPRCDVVSVQIRPLMQTI